MIFEEDYELGISNSQVPKGAAERIAAGQGHLVKRSTRRHALIDGKPLCVQNNERLAINYAARGPTSFLATGERGIPTCSHCIEAIKKTNQGDT